MRVKGFHLHSLSTAFLLALAGVHSPDALGAEHAIAGSPRPAFESMEVIGSPRRLPEIAGSATLINSEELNLSRVMTINEALRKAPGVVVRDEEGLGLRPNIGLRGLNPTRSTKVLLLEDGLPLAYAPYGDNASYYHPPVERFDRIEVLKGSEQILFGPQTIGGVINYITPAPPDDFEGRVRLTGGNREYFNGHLQVGGKGLLLDVMRKQSDGARDNEHSEIDDVNLKGVFTFAGNQALTLKANYYAEDSDVTYTGLTDAELRNFGYEYNPFDNDNFNVDRFGTSASHEIAFTPDLILTSNLYFTHFKRHWWRQSSTTTDGQCGAAFTAARLAGTRVFPDSCNSLQGRLRSYYTYGLEERLFVGHQLFGLRQEFQAGIRAHYESQDREQQNGTNPNVFTGRIVEDNERDVNAYSLFAQNRLLLGRFTLTPGVRVEYVENERTNNRSGASGDDDLTEVIPGLGATYNPMEQITLFAGVHRGFAPPRTEDLIVTPDNNPLATFTEVDAEESWNAEIGLRSELRPGARFETTFFRNDFDNQIQVGSIAGGTTPLAQGETLYEGLELFARFDSLKLFDTRDNFYVQTAYTFLPTADQESPVRVVQTGAVVAGSREGNRLPYAPRHLATTSLGFTHTRTGLDLRLEAVHVSSQFADFANTQSAAFNGNGQVGVIKASTVFNLAVNYPVRRYDATLFLAAKNLFDRDYIVDRTRGIRVGAPLLVQGGVEIAF
ncbi:MAG: TonB-dependent receptor family protein [Gammaproteobacteria bacterium]